MTKHMSQEKFDRLVNSYAIEVMWTISERTYEVRNQAGKRFTVIIN